VIYYTKNRDISLNGAVTQFSHIKLPLFIAIIIKTTNKNMADPIPQQIDTNVNLIHSKASNKRDLCFIVAHELDAYLPGEESITVFFLKDLLSGTRKVSF